MGILAKAYADGVIQTNKEVYEFPAELAGGRNLLKNSNDFTKFTTSLYNGSKVSLKTGVAISEFGATDATELTLTRGTDDLVSTPPINYKPLGYFIYSFYAKNTGSVNIEFRYNGADYLRPLIDGDVYILKPGEARYIYFKGKMRSSYEWFQHQIRIPSASQGTVAKVVLWRSKLEIGDGETEVKPSNKATPWTPAPEDIGLNHYPEEITYFGGYSGGYVTMKEMIEIPSNLVGGKNLLKSDADALPVWTENSTGGGKSVVIDGVTESHVLTKTTTDTASVDVYSWLESRMISDFDKNKVFTISVDVYHESDSMKTLTFGGRDNVTPYLKLIKEFNVEPYKWTRVHRTFNYSRDDSRFLMHITTKGIKSLRTRHLKVEYGTEPTPFVYPSGASVVNNSKPVGRNLARNGEKVIVPATTGSYNYYTITPTVPLEVGATYTVSCRYYPTVADRNVPTIYPYPGGSHSHMPVDSNRYISHTFKVTSADTKTVLIYTAKSGETANVGATLEHIKLEKGDVATPWSPAPEDKGFTLDNSVFSLGAPLSIAKSNTIIGELSQYPNISTTSLALSHDFTGSYNLDNLVYDLSGEFNHSRLYNFTTPSVDNGLQFNGTNQYMITTSGFTNDYGNTYEFVITPDTNMPEFGTLLSDKSQSNSEGFVWIRNAINGALSIQFVDGTQYHTTASAAGLATPGKQTHVAIVINYAARTCKFYGNGVLWGTYTHTSDMKPPVNNRKIYIGRYNENHAYIFKGKMHAVAIYERPLSDSEVKANYEARKDRY